MSGHVLVVGASAAGLSTVESLRRKGYSGEVTVLGAEPHVPYDRPPLSKQVLAGVWEPERATLRQPAALSALDADVVLGDPATSLDLKTRAVHTAAGRTLHADTVVVATGARPRILPSQTDVDGMHVLRTLDDCLRLRADLLRAKRVAVVGEGVLGTEVAATARGMGLPVTVIGPQPEPMRSQLGPLVAEQLAQRHTAAGVEWRLETGVAGFAERDGRVAGVRLDTGEVVPADVVVVAIGAAPDTGWLQDSGLELDDGIVCDSRCRAAEGVYAAGDAATWWHEQLGSPVRLDNRTNATMQAAAVADNILGADTAYTPVPYFWTDQYDVKLQMYGFPFADCHVTVAEGAVSQGRFVARYERDGRVVAVLGWNMPKQARLHRREIVESLAVVETNR